MSKLISLIEKGLQTLSQQHTAETLGDRSTYIGASEVGSCPRKTILTKAHGETHGLTTLLRFKKGHMTEDIVAEALKAAGLTNFEQQVEVSEGPLMAHIDFVFTSETAKVKSVLECKSVGVVPDSPWGSWETQLHIQMGLLKQDYPDYEIRGAILAVDLNKEIRVFEGYASHPQIFQGLKQKAMDTWAAYEQYRAGDSDVLMPTEIGPLCAYCAWFANCPKFDAQEVPELTEQVANIVAMCDEQKRLKAQVDDQKAELLEIVQRRGSPVRTSDGTVLQEAKRTRKNLDAAKVIPFLTGNGANIEDFQTSLDFVFLDIKRGKK